MDFLQKFSWGSRQCFSTDFCRLIPAATLVEVYTEIYRGVTSLINLGISPQISQRAFSEWLPKLLAKFLVELLTRFSQSSF